MRLLGILAAVAAALLVADVAQAAPRVPDPPMVLPGDVSIASVRADEPRAGVGGRPGAATDRLARAAGARKVVEGGWVVPRERARALAAALRRAGRLTYAEPNRLSTLRQTPPRAVADDPLSVQVPWRDAAVDPALAPPPVSPDSPILALVDAKADVAHSEFTSGGNLVTLDGRAVEVDHGTATAAVAGAPVNGIGMVGVWPGMRMINVPLPADEIRCTDSARGIRRAVASGAAVINMSYGSTAFCQTEYLALQEATRAGVTLVAAAGNEFDRGNPLEFPASLPHVLTVGASTPDDQAAFFSNQNAAMDLVAPGVSIIAAVPVALDTEDGTQDGYTLVDGTSFSAPMVAAAATWLRQARPDLTVDQVAQVIRLSARDISTKGYDRSTGFGALNLAAALQRTPPAADVQEPNDDIGFVDGRAFDAPTPAVFTKDRRADFRALLDVYEDPADVYRLRVPPRRTVTVTIRPTFGNPDLALFSGSAQAVRQSRLRIARSRHSAQHTDTVRFRNSTGRTRTVYARVWIRPASGLRTLDAGYRLTAR